MKELYTIGQEMQEQIGSEQMSLPTFEKVSEMQRRYLEFLRACRRQPRGVETPKPQTETAV